MSTSTARLSTGVRGNSVWRQLRAYFWADNRRAVQTVLGLIWLLDGGLQFQSFMYSKGFIQLLTGQAAGQPGWLADSINWAAGIANGNLAVFNTLFALTQVTIGLGLLYRRTVKPALALSFAWVLVVWWFGEAFGMLFMDMAQPLTGAPGAVVLYGLVGLIVWPGRGPGGLLGVRGAKIMWAALWLAMAWLWLLAPSSSANATHDALISVDTGMGWLNALQNNAAVAAKGNGLVIALVLAAVSAAIGIAVAADWRPRFFLGLAIVLSLVYWLLPQGLGGIFAGGSTDPNAGLPFVLLACAMYPLITPRAEAHPPARLRTATQND
ncbi:MAG: hypothetical protein WAK93_14140 [Solirubrobacteraceae bacterium]